MTLQELTMTLQNWCHAGYSKYDITLRINNDSKNMYLECPHLDGNTIELGNVIQLNFSNKK